jgi:formylglycine-generating enzyme
MLLIEGSTMNTKSFLVFFFAMCALLAVPVMAGTISIDLVPVGDAGNAADPLTGYGAVAYTYQMGKYDVTTAQYAVFLNSVATSGDPYGLYNPKMATGLPTYGILRTSGSSGYSYQLKGNGNVPVFDVSWGDAARFVNWLQNGQPNGVEGPGTTETGSYAMGGGTSDVALMTVTRGAGAQWVLPTRDEWYKTAYYKGGGTNAGYWVYPTRSNSMPSNLLSPTGTNNANFFDHQSGGDTDPVSLLTVVGAFAASPGPYGTYDQGGDVWQWNESAVNRSYRDTYGGSFADVSVAFASTSHNYLPPTFVDQSIGFRVAYVPEPSSAAMLLAAAATTLFLLRHQPSMSKIKE